MDQGKEDHLGVLPDKAILTRFIDWTRQFQRALQPATNLSTNHLDTSPRAPPTHFGHTTAVRNRDSAFAMSKGTQFVSFAVPTFVLYVLALFHFIPVPFFSSDSADAILPVVSGSHSHKSTTDRSTSSSYFFMTVLYPSLRPLHYTLHISLSYSATNPSIDTFPLFLYAQPSIQLPWWLLVSFGAYSLSSLGLGLLRFNDCPDAYESLIKEIHQAKTELRNQGVDVD